jgi:hypothetical protein
MQKNQKRCTRKHILSPLKDTSIKSVSKTIADELKSVPSKYSTNQTFIPFIHERDAIGRLILPSFIRKSKLKKHSPKNVVLLKSFEPKPKRSPLRNSYKGDIPPIGLYDIKENWIKRSFSNKSLGNITPVTKNQVDSAKSVIQMKVIPKSDSLQCLKRKKSSVPPRKKGIWEEIPILNSPEQLSTILSFKNEKRRVRGVHVSITKSLEKLKEDYYL